MNEVKNEASERSAYSVLLYGNQQEKVIMGKILQFKKSRRDPSMQNYTTQQLKQMWDSWDNYFDREDECPLKFHYDELHLELNRRGAGEHCAV